MFFLFVCTVRLFDSYHSEGARIDIEDAQKKFAECQNKVNFEQTTVNNLSIIRETLLNANQLHIERDLHQDILYLSLSSSFRSLALFFRCNSCWKNSSSRWLWTKEKSGRISTESEVWCSNAGVKDSDGFFNHSTTKVLRILFVLFSVLFRSLFLVLVSLFLLHFHQLQPVSLMLVLHFHLLHQSVPPSLFLLLVILSLSSTHFQHLQPSLFHLLIYFQVLPFLLMTRKKERRWRVILVGDCLGTAMSLFLLFRSGRIFFAV